MVVKKNQKFHGFTKRIFPEKMQFNFISQLKQLKRNEIFFKKKLFAKDFLSRATNNDFMYKGSFQQAMAPVLTMAQIFALLPVSGIKSENADNLVFSWKQFRTLYSVFVIIFQIIYCILTYWWTFSQPFKFKSSEPLIFYTTVIIVSIKFLFLAKKWPELMRLWEDVEIKLPPLKNQMEKSMLAHKIKMITFVAMMLSLAEHLLSMISSFHYANNCPARPDPIESYFAGQSDQIFYVFEFSIWLGIFGKYLNILSTFVWNFMDIFVMLISVGLSSRFRQVNESLMKAKGLEVPYSFWLNHRLHYRSLCILCEEVDNAISLITLISFSNNLYFVCGKLLRSIKKKPSYAHAVYFWFSLTFLLGRTLMISLYSADVADQAKQPLKVFRSVPRNSWCPEIRRFAEEVSSDIIALSGMKFFHITRGLVLTVAGTIVTYELVLIQFQDDQIAYSNC